MRPFVRARIWLDEIQKRATKDSLDSIGATCMTKVSLGAREQHRPRPNHLNQSMRAALFPAPIPHNGFCCRCWGLHRWRLQRMHDC
jgi:hypothetical protein